MFKKEEVKDSVVDDTAPTLILKKTESELFVTLRRGSHGLWHPIGIRVYKGQVLEEFEIYTDDTRYGSENKAMSWLMQEQGLL